MLTLTFAVNVQRVSFKLVAFIAVLSCSAELAVTGSEKQGVFNCWTGEFDCGNETCIPGNWKCDGEADCPDESDEENCSPRSCTVRGEFQCHNTRCIPVRWVCDGEDDCEDMSDEGKTCGDITCAVNEFTCGNKKCIPRIWQCDGHNDCGDNSDEEQCTSTKPPICLASELTCSNHRCVSKRWVCDGDDDCDDGSDEKDCPNLSCESTDFTCANKRCIPNRWRCDGDNDCGDHSDEDGCPSAPPQYECQNDLFSCHGGTIPCVMKAWVCDGDRDCLDGSDELDCPSKECGEDEFRCTNTSCIPLREKCDGKENCWNGLDEQNCATNPPVCTDEHFKCAASSVCIEQSRVCDGMKDCPNGDDEPVNCGLNECQQSNGHCQQKCVDLKIGFTCNCSKGFKLHEDGRTCIDVDECQILGTCSQICDNLKGSFKCECHQGYILEPDRRTCRATGPKEYLIFANRKDVRKMSTDAMQFDEFVSDQKGAVGVAYDSVENYIYWTDVKEKAIKRIQLNSTYGKAEVILSGLTMPDDIAFDWIGRKIYWTDSLQNYIQVVEVNGHNKYVVIRGGLDEPRAIAVDPTMGYLYWTDWGDQPRIERSSMDGDSTTRQTLVNTHLHWPNALTIDYQSMKLFWMDAKLRKLECSNFDGTNRLTIINGGLHHPFSVSVFGEYLYWTDWDVLSVYKANKFSGKDMVILKDNLYAPMGIQVIHPLTQPNASSPCSLSNGGCSHLCLGATVPKLYSCACPSGNVLSGDGRSCIPEVKPFQHTTPPPPSTVKPINLDTTSSVNTKKSTHTSSNTQDSGTDSPTTAWDNRVPRDHPTNKTNKNPVHAALEEKEDSQISVGVILSCALVSIVLAALVVGLLVWRLKSRAKYGFKVRYNPADDSRPLEEDFDQDEPQTIGYEENGPRSRVAFA